MGRGNVLFMTIDQLSARVLEGPLGQAVATPNIDRLRAESCSFRNHYTVTAPCGPARASLLTGLYAMNHRAIRNGTPLARHHATLASEARRAGYEPLLFGYTDTTADPGAHDPGDPDLIGYEGVAAGFRQLTEMHFDSGYEWPAYLRARGYEVALEHGAKVPRLFRPVAPEGRPPGPDDPALYRAEDSDTAYLTDQALRALDIRAGRGWFAHLSYIRPHPPLVAPAPYNALIDPETLPAPDLARLDHPLIAAWFSEASKQSLFWGFDGDCTGIDAALGRRLRAVYLGLLAEFDRHLGRILDWLETSGQADDTLVVLTADHGDMLGEQGIWGKDCVFDPVFHIPLWIRDPRRPAGAGRSVTVPTESVDLMPSILDWIGQPVPAACDGYSLLPLIDGEPPANWRDAVLLEVDFGEPDGASRFQRHLGLPAEQMGVAILREARWKYVHCGGGLPPMLFDLDADPGERRNLIEDPAHAHHVTRLARRLIDRMMERRDRRLTHISLGR